MIRGYLDRMLRRRDATTRAPHDAVTATCDAPSVRLFIPASLYDEAERQGYDMRGYIRQQSVPVAH